MRKKVDKKMRWFFQYAKDLQKPIDQADNIVTKEFATVWKMLWFMLMDKIARKASGKERIVIKQINDEHHPQKRP